MAGVLNIPWYSTLFRGDQFEAALSEIAPVCLRYGATDFEVMKFTNLTTGASEATSVSCDSSASSSSSVWKSSSTCSATRYISSIKATMSSFVEIAGTMS